jgi:dolichol-phosphate mannosyltransferase
MLVSIIIPYKNEPYLNRLISEINNALTCSHEILVQTEPGLANAVICGTKKAKGNILVVLDGDGSHDPRNLNKMVNLVATYPVVVGSRYINGGVTNDSRSRQFLSRLFCRIARIILKLEIYDPMSGFVAIDHRVLKRVHLAPFGYKFALELLVKANGCFRVLECPIIFEARKMGNSKTGIKVGISAIAFILLLRLRKKIHNY